ncbi:HAD family hydrolase [Romboutsia weinsteinii]|uniref:hypothetical protein n=1 Tax=Romboutsia weinsteinii TaxID=2020949 RepID=UPI0013143638|nr:hypothetical protein [Romboutsia weinsteinii]
MRNNWNIFAEKILEHFDISDDFDFIVGRDLDGTRFKKNEVIIHVLEENKI